MWSIHAGRKSPVTIHGAIALGSVCSRETIWWINSRFREPSDLLGPNRNYKRVKMSGETPTVPVVWPHSWRNGRKCVRVTTSNNTSNIALLLDFTGVSFSLTRNSTKLLQSLPIWSCRSGAIGMPELHTVGPFQCTAPRLQSSRLRAIISPPCTCQKV
jgi:hypothetical protein